MNPFTERVVTIIKSIPPGHVMTYGQIAKLAGSPRGARQVVRILHSMSEKYNLPWHRVINSKGEIGFKDEASMFEQITALENEGIEFKLGNRIHLVKYIFDPDINK
ncbi:MGMT family protein [Bacillus sp. 31A1R]|uniref:MGMT family protein n=1 Tax=Robertmurraya mangrovi TaxID=3098077 RepID=A0ABU5IZP0_9BACI|nr:MGMT family protein [Bacillus sp. 31A1R]MDZ5472623.1 MGMT family protein [Bacillus sp. 31A1R]